MLAVIVLCYSQKKVYNPEQFPVLKGAYLGQEPPGLIPKIFAPGIVSTGQNESCPAFTPGGNELYFVRGKNSKRVIYFMKEENGQWIAPKIAPFSGEYDDAEFTLSPRGDKLIFISKRPIERNGEPLKYFDIWMVERIGEGWNKPKNLGSVINSDEHEAYPSLSLDRTLYFSSNRQGGKGGWDIYRSRFVNGRYTRPENLENSINTENDEFDSFIAPDESYIIFGAVGRKEGSGGCDLYVSFRKRDGNWIKAKNVGKRINSNKGDSYPVVSPGGKYFFFNRSTMENSIIYWVDAKIIKLLRPNE